MDRGKCTLESLNINSCNKISAITFVFLDFRFDTYVLNLIIHFLGGFMSNVTLKQEEIQNLRVFQTEFHTLTKRYGEALFQIRLLSKEIQSIEVDMDVLENNRKQMMKSLQENYGAGTIELDTGMFVPANNTDEAPTQ